MNTGNLNGLGLAELQNFKFQNLSSAPTTNLSKGRFYFNTTDNTLYVYDGTTWVDALVQGGTYLEGAGIDITSGTISIDLATGANAGNVTLTTTNGLAASIGDASTSAKGVIEIATDSEATTGTSETLAVNPKQLSTKVDKLSTKPTAGDYTKVTINGEGQVTAGTTLSASDIPSLTLSKISDVTVSASDVNSVTSKIGLTNLSIDSGSTNYLGYDNTNGKFSAKVDTTVTASSTNLVTSGAVDTAIGNAIVGGVKYVGTWTATGQTDYSSITLPVKKGYLYLVEGSATITAGSKTIEWNEGDYLMVNANVASGGTLTDVKKIDNTEATDIVRLNATQTLTNKTIDADDNTISDLTTSNLKSGVLQTTVRATSSASDTALASEKAIATALSGKASVYSTTNTALTVSGGVCTWTVTHNIGENVTVQVYEVSSGEQIIPNSVVLTSSTVATVGLLATADIDAGTYKVVVTGA